MARTYSELSTIESFEDRFRYLQLKGNVGGTTFGSHRRLNQILNKLPDWRSARNAAVIRDNGCDLGHPDFEIHSQPVYVHHIEPITEDDIRDHRRKVFDLDNLITTTFQTHQAIHYGDENLLPKLPVERKPNDTCPWK